MPRELLIMQNSFQWGTAEGQTLEIENAIRSRVRDLKIEGQTYQNLLSETKSPWKFVYNDITGEYTLTNPTVDSWNSMAINYTRPIQAGEKLLIRLNIVKNTIVTTTEPPIKITWSDPSYSYTGHINVKSGVDGLFECYCDGAVATEPYNTKIEISTRNYTSGELIIKDIQVIPVSENPLSYTELPTSINGIESVAERERNLANYIINAIGTLGKKVVFDNKNCLKITSTFSRTITLPDINDYKIYVSAYANNTENKIYSIGEFNGKYIAPGIKKWQSNTLTANLNKFSLYNFQNSEIYIDLDSLILERVNNKYPIKIAQSHNETDGITLPNGIKNSIENGKHIKRVGKITFNGSQTFIYAEKSNRVSCSEFVYRGSPADDIPNPTPAYFMSCVCDNPIFKEYIQSETKPAPSWESDGVEMVCAHGGRIVFIINNDRITDKTNEAINEWFKNNPTTFYYELATPITEPLTPTEIPLPQPLRSLPNGVCDEVVGNKLIQRIGKFVIDGSQNFSVDFNNINNGRVWIPIAGVIRIKANTKDHNCYCDRFPTDDIPNVACCFVAYKNQVIFLPPIGMFSSGEEIKEWFKNNPTTLYYELETPIEHTINVPPISIPKGSNIITTENNIKPKLSMKVKVKK